jgi:CMP/dCMP kinase
VAAQSREWGKMENNNANPIIITLSGTAGSGKSTAGKLLAKALDCKFYGAGDVRRKFAAERGMTLEELNKLSETDPASDIMVDKYIKKMGMMGESFVIDGRLGFNFIPHSVKIFLDAEPNVRATRILKDKRSEESYSGIDEMSRAMDERQLCDTRRYLKLYNINPYHRSHYDLVVDSSDKTPEEVADEIHRFVMKIKNENRNDSASIAEEDR